MEKARFNHELIANLTAADVEKMSEDDVIRALDYISPATAHEAAVTQEDSSLLKRGTNKFIKSMLATRERTYSKLLLLLRKRLDFLHKQEGF